MVVVPHAVGAKAKALRLVRTRVPASRHHHQRPVRNLCYLSRSGPGRGRWYGCNNHQATPADAAVTRFRPILIRHLTVCSVV